MVDRHRTRNAHIWSAYINGTPVEDLACDFRLSQSQIRRILAKVKAAGRRAQILYAMIPALDILFGLDCEDQGAD